MRILVVGKSPFQNEGSLFNSNELKNIEFFYSRDFNSAYYQWEACAPDLVAIYFESNVDEVCDLIIKIRINPNYDYTQIVTLSSEKNPKFRLDCLSAGSDDYIELPIQRDEVVYRILSAQKFTTSAQRSALVESLSQLLAMRDADSGKQFYQISNYCRIIAEEMRKVPKYSGIITDRFLDELVQFSSIHDLGKIGMDDSILKKPGRYTQAEKDKMKLHTIVGAECINEISSQYPGMRSLKAASEIIRWHHEHYDGTGYPDGLQGDEIPLQAKIVAVADVYDALVNERVYKKAFTHEDAMRILLIEERRFYDPDVLSAFIKAEREIMCLRTKITDMANNCDSEFPQPTIGRGLVPNIFEPVANKDFLLWRFPFSK